jgi:hypothetical protein
MESKGACGGGDNGAGGVQRLDLHLMQRGMLVLAVPPSSTPHPKAAAAWYAAPRQTMVAAFSILDSPAGSISTSNQVRLSSFFFVFFV